MHDESKYEVVKCWKTEDTKHNWTPPYQTHNTSFEHQAILFHILLVYLCANPVLHFGI